MQEPSTIIMFADEGATTVPLARVHYLAVRRLARHAEHALRNLIYAPILGSTRATTNDTHFRFL